jgi:hypothetical protein
MTRENDGDNFLFFNKVLGKILIVLFFTLWLLATAVSELSCFPIEFLKDRRFFPTKAFSSQERKIQISHCEKLSNFSNHLSCHKLVWPISKKIYEMCML